VSSESTDGRVRRESEEGRRKALCVRRQTGGWQKRHTKQLSSCRRQDRRNQRLTKDPAQAQDDM